MRLRFSCFSRRMFVGALFLSFLAASGLTGCAKIQTEPFSKFSASVQELRAGADQAATMIGSWSQERTVERAASMEPRSALSFIGKMQINPGRAKDNGGQLYEKIDRFRQGLNKFNTALVEYSSALQELASPELVDEAAFDALRADLNTNLKAAATAFGIGEVETASGTFNVDKFALLSTITAQVLQSYFESLRKDELIAAISGQQDQIEAASALGRSAIENIRNSLNNSYADLYGAYMNKAAGCNEDGSIAQNVKVDVRKKAMEKLISLNNNYYNELQALDALDAAYEKLPTANRELAKSITKPGSPLQAIKDIYSAAQRLYSAYAALSKANQE